MCCFAKPGETSDSGHIQYAFRHGCVMILDKAMIWLNVAKPVRQLGKCFAQWMSHVTKWSCAFMYWQSFDYLARRCSHQCCLWQCSIYTHSAQIVCKHIHSAHATMSGNSLPISTRKTQTLWWNLRQDRTMSCWQGLHEVISIIKWLIKFVII